MKNLIFFITALINTLTVSAQDFQGMAVYESKTSTADFQNRMQGNRDITPEMQKMFEERMKKAFEKTFILNFNKSESIYKEEEKLEAPGQNQGGFRMMTSMMGGGGTFYKNVKTKSYAVDKEFMGKEFLVKDSLKTIKWEMSGDSKQIGGYTCYKATAVLPASKSDLRNFRPRRQEEDEKKKAEEAKKKADSEKKTNLMDEVELAKEITITAWFAPEIPVSQGPESYWGLPGLILEVSDGKTVILCSKVVLNSKDKVEIKAPKKGKEISQAEYDDVVVKKMEEFRQNGGPGGPGGRRMN
ncbi:GLPGLI family protein [Flavobacterium silvaticum]|uniref:GLPGLI family protein n=1 Tax=Flavobacterium silvaticum TaxID=1852020 RepID=A0A972FPW4_9FLAO|nr:GLPGLI family protein [Flavobacterium silvaticum]NMH27229.1 GLPGLI family protein [Flavobacterium silvaticum]